MNDQETNYENAKKRRGTPQPPHGEPFAAWHFNCEMAEATVAYHNDGCGKKDQFMRWTDAYWVDAGARFYWLLQNELNFLRRKIDAWERRRQPPATGKNSDAFVLGNSSNKVGRSTTLALLRVFQTSLLASVPGSKS